jgi:hypothetical protein
MLEIQSTSVKERVVIRTCFGRANSVMRPTTSFDVDGMCNGCLVRHSFRLLMSISAKGRGQNRQGISQKQTNDQLHKVVLNGIARGSTARGDADLAIDRGQVGVDRARTDHELFGHLGVGQSLGHQAQHLHFSGGQSCWIGGRGLRWWS